MLRLQFGKPRGRFGVRFSVSIGQLAPLSEPDLGQDEQQGLLKEFTHAVGEILMYSSASSAAILASYTAAVILSSSSSS